MTDTPLGFLVHVASYRFSLLLRRLNRGLLLALLVALLLLLLRLLVATVLLVIFGHILLPASRQTPMPSKFLRHEHCQPPRDAVAVGGRVAC